MVYFLHYTMQDTVLQKIQYIYLNICEKHLSDCKSFWDRNLRLQGFSDSRASSKKSNNVSIGKGQETIYKVWETSLRMGKELTI